MKVGLIGFGRLGSHLSQFLSESFDVAVYDSDFSKKRAVLDMGFEWAESYEGFSDCDFIIPFVPISEFEKTISDLAPHLKSGQTLVDVCSVKVMPIKWMTEKLPEDVAILGTHPMFGPDSTKETLFGQKIVLCPVRINKKRFEEIKHFLNSFGLKLIETTPEDHDKQIAETLLLSHFIGRTLIDFDAQKHKIDTLGYRRLLKILSVVENDSWQLFLDMNKYNPYAKDLRDRFLKSLQSISQKVEDL